jgi:hypothetical protein
MLVIDRPIVLLGAPRSRTSLTSHLFHVHGCWVGNYKAGDKNNPKGYFENRDFKKALIDKVGRDCVHQGFVCREVAGWEDITRNILETTGYEGGPWVAKHSVMYWPVWKPLNPFFVSIRRGMKAIKDSCKATGYLNSDMAIEAHIKELDRIEEDLGAYRLDTDRYFTGDWAQLDSVMSAAGLEFDKELAERVVDEKYNRFGG